MFLAIADAGGSKEQIWLEESASAVIQALVKAQEPVPEYYNIVFSTLEGVISDVEVQPVTLKTGSRAAAPAREIAKIQSGGVDVGAAIVEK